MGNSPSNADRFLSLLHSIPQEQMSYTVVGFGSKLYPDYCAFAKAIDQELKGQSWARPFLPLYTVNDQSIEEFLEWVNRRGTYIYPTIADK